METKTKAQLLALLGFSAAATSCEALNGLGGGGGLCMYGTPSASYQFNIDVKDLTTEEPVEGIRVSLIERHTQLDHTTQEKVEYVDTLATELTDANGRAILKHGGMPLHYNKAEIAADDVDGSANGDYNSTNVEFQIYNSDYVDDDDNSWSLGKVTKDITMKIDKK